MQNKKPNMLVIIAIILFFASVSFGSGFLFFVFLLYSFFTFGRSIYMKRAGEGEVSGGSSNSGIGRSIFGDFFSSKKKVVSFGFICFTLFMLFQSVMVIEAGEVGVKVFFGDVSETPLYSGIQLVNPLANVVTFDARTQQYYMGVVQDQANTQGADDMIKVLTAEGLSVDLDISALYRVKPEETPRIYKTVGVDYGEKIIRPEIRSVIRETLAQYSAKDIYSEKRQEIVSRVVDALKIKLEARGIVLEDVLLRNVNLPQDLANAIQEKLRTEQESQKYDFILEKETKEAERKRIEAEGQKQYQKIINESLSTNYLYYQYINQLKDRPGTIYVPTSPESGMPQFKVIQ